MLFLVVLLVFHNPFASAGFLKDDEILHLKETLQKQSDIIKALEDRISKLEAKLLEDGDTVSDLEAKVVEGERTISKLKESRIRKNAQFEHQLKELQGEINKLRQTCSMSKATDVQSEETRIQSPEVYHAGNTSLNSKHGTRQDLRDEIFVHKRLLSLPSLSGSDAVSTPPSFFAYKTQNEVKPSPHVTLIYDHVVTNVGNGYNNFSGIFTVPVAGMYVFFWSTRLGSGEESTELIINNVPINVIHNYGTFETSTGFAVVHVNVNDVVFVRTHSTLSSTGEIWSNKYGKTAFGGWALNLVSV